MWQHTRKCHHYGMSTPPDDPATSSPGNSGSRTSSLVGKTYSSRGERRRQYMTRLPEPTYQRLMEASDATGLSANTLVVEAVEEYLHGPIFRTRLTESREKNNQRLEAERRRKEVIRRLSGA